MASQDDNSDKDRSAEKAAARRARGAERFYGRRMGHPLTERQQRVMDEVLPGLRLDPGVPPPDDLTRLFCDPVTDLVLEIGFGAGEHFVAEAARERMAGHIGVEPFLNGVARVAGAAEEQGLGNVRLYDDDARDLLNWLPDACLARIDLLYPDPWPKTRHWKRRIFNRRNLAIMARVLKPGGALHFATDIESYVDWALYEARFVPSMVWTARRPEDWRTPWPHWTRTRYEAKALREGRRPHYLTFLRQAR